jgi:hypothetical protein
MLNKLYLASFIDITIASKVNTLLADDNENINHAYVDLNLYIYCDLCTIQYEFLRRKKNSDTPLHRIIGILTFVFTRIKTKLKIFKVFFKSLFKVNCQNVTINKILIKIVEYTIIKNCQSVNVLTKSE